MDKKVLERLDREIDRINVFSRSEAVEKIIEKHIAERKKCVILAGGDPKNLYSEELKCYRPLAKIKGHTLIEDIVEKIKKAGYKDIIFVGSKELISACFSILGDGKGAGVDMEYAEEKEHLGSAKTLELASTRIKGSFLFLPCDHYFETDLRAVESYHRENKGIATLVIYSGTKYEWKKSSIVELEGNIIKEYVETPKAPRTHLTAIMIGMANPEIFSFIPSGKITWSLQKNVFPELAAKGKLIGYIYSGKWKNIHDKKDLEML